MRKLPRKTSWTDKELQSLREYWGNVALLKKKIPRKPIETIFAKGRALRLKASAFGFSADKHNVWRDWEIQYLKDKFPTTEIIHISIRLNRSYDAVSCKANTLGLKRVSSKRGCVWYPNEIAFLRKVWGDYAPRLIHDGLKRHKWRAIYACAQRLGLPFGTPQGMETLESASRRSGYSREGLRTVLEFANVRIHYRYRADRWSSHGRHGFVEPDDVDSAIALYSKTETFSSAARRLHVDHETLRAALRKSKVDFPKRSFYRNLPEFFECVLYKFKSSKEKRRT